VFTVRYRLIPYMKHVTFHLLKVKQMRHVPNKNTGHLRILKKVLGMWGLIFKTRQSQEKWDKLEPWSITNILLCIPHQDQF
jgi:hypothetical protein